MTPEEFQKQFELLMSEALDTFDDRNKLYKNGWESSGELIEALFPKGVRLFSKEDHARFGLVSMMIAKLSRYCTNFNIDGHDDSLLDLTVYSNILRTYDKQLKGKFNDNI